MSLIKKRVVIKGILIQVVQVLLAYENAYEHPRLSALRGCPQYSIIQATRNDRLSEGKVITLLIQAS